MRATPRKNFRGFWPHVQALTDQLVRDQFPDLGSVYVNLSVLHAVRESALAHWYQCKLDKERDYRSIMLDTDTPGGREFFLTADDDDLRNLLTHELLHGELRRKGLPSGDNDAPFIMECLRRRIIVNDSSVDAFEAAYGRGSFETFRAFLPAPKTETISLAGETGVWVHETRE